MASRSAALVVVAIGLLAGCSSPADEDVSQDSPVAFPARAESRSSPLMLVHGFNGGAKSDSANWDVLVATLRDLGWDQDIIRWGYYSCDVGFDDDASRYGSHDTHLGNVENHDGECNAGSHGLATPIEHLAYHWAWGIYERFAADWKCVDVAAHSMGGLVVRYAIAQVERGDPEFPPRLCVYDAVTLGTPHGGSIVALLCGAVSWSYQCEEMTTGSALLQWLGANADHPDGEGGTDWTTVASDDDAVVSTAWALAMGSDHRVRYVAGNNVHHADTSNYQDLILGEQTARVVFWEPERGWAYSAAAHWPVHWLDQALVFGQEDWSPISPNGSPALEWADPQPGSYQVASGTGFEVEVECLDDPEGQDVYVEFLVDGVNIETDRDVFGMSPSFRFTPPDGQEHVYGAQCIDDYYSSSPEGLAQWHVMIAGGTPPGGSATRESLATQQPMAVASEDYAWLEFASDGSKRFHYDFVITDSSTLDSGVIRASDLDAYLDGADVETWGYQSQAESANEEFTLTAGSYDLVFYCWNSVFDCDIEYSAWMDS